MKKFFFELSGEHPAMPSAEALACIEAESESSSLISSGPGYIIAEFDENAVDRIGERIALTHHFGTFLGSFRPEDFGKIEKMDIPEGTFAIRSKRFKGMMVDVDSQDLTRKLGALLSKKNGVNLKNPDIEIRLHLSDMIHVYVSERSSDPNILESRKVGERPFFSPISLHPKYARAAINLTGVKRGGTVLDPFCGTGGVAIEAAFMGMNAVVSDFDEAMVDGCIENMNFYGLKLKKSEVLDVGDVPDHFSDVDSVVTDPPYGRSTCTGGEDVESIYARAAPSISAVLKESGRACMVLPHEFHPEQLQFEKVFVQKVHGSLSRHYHIFKKN